jgi:hypothetical protein
MGAAGKRFEAGVEEERLHFFAPSPGKQMPRILPTLRSSRNLLANLIPVLVLLPALASAQFRSNLVSPYASAQGALPSEGPAAARLNPAFLADVNLASLAIAHYGSVSGKDGVLFLQLALGMPQDLSPFPFDLSAGIGYMSTGSMVDGSNSIFKESEYDPGFAVRLPVDPESPWHVAAGLNFAIDEYNAFNAVRSTSVGVDAGWLFSIRAGTAGLFGLGFAYHDLSSPRIRLPDGNGDYKIPGWMEPSFAWSSPARLLRAQVAMYIDEARDNSEGPAPEAPVGFSGWELEVKPWEWLALKGERTRTEGRSNLGLVLYLPPKWVHFDTRMELNVGNEKIDPYGLPIPFLATWLGGKGQDEGLGWLVGASLSVGI